VSFVDESKNGRDNIGKCERKSKYKGKIKGKWEFVRVINVKKIQALECNDSKKQCCGSA
jgi:hypothetical protein